LFFPLRVLRELAEGAQSVRGFIMHGHANGGPRHRRAFGGPIGLSVLFNDFAEYRAKVSVRNKKTALSDSSRHGCHSAGASFCDQGIPHASLIRDYQGFLFTLQRTQGSSE